MSDLKEDIATLKENARWQNAEIAEIKSDVKSVLEWKWKIVGAAGVVGALASAVVQYFSR